MPIPSPKCQIYPVAGETAIKNIVDGTLFTGTGTPTLVDDGAEKAWSIVTGTLLEQAIPSKTINGSVAGAGAAIVIRFKTTADGSGADFMPLIGVKTTAGSIANDSVTITRNGSGSYRGRAQTGIAAIAGSKANNVIHTLVYKVSLDDPALDVGKIWWNTAGRVGTAPNAVSTGANFSTLTVTKAFINCQNSAAFTLLDFAWFDVEPTDADCAAIADNYRAVMPSPSSDPAPTGIVTLGTPTDITSSSATIPYFYSENDETGFEYRLNGGSALPVTSSPLLLTSLDAGTFYSTEMRAMNGSTPGDWSDPATFTTAAGGDTTPPTFTVAPAVTSITQTGGTATATINETGSIFYVVVPQAQATPSVTQVIAGQNASGTAPIDSGSAVGTTTLSDAFTDLAAGAAYKACFAARDDEPTPNVQAAVTVVNFNAAAAPVGTITITGVADNVNTPWISSAVDIATIMPMSLGSVVVNKTGLSTTAGADLVITDAAIATGTEYIILLKIGTAYGWYRAVAT